MARSRLAITGTPGVGKTTLAQLVRDGGRAVADFKELAATNHAIVGHDDLDQSDVIDVDALQDKVMDAVEGHMAHMLEVDVIWVVRCEPSILKGRLEARGYSPAKVHENLEAEAMDLILQEALEAGARVIQRDGTHRTPNELLSAFVEAKTSPLNSHDIEPVDWSDWLLDSHGS